MTVKRLLSQLLLLRKSKTLFTPLHPNLGKRFLINTATAPAAHPAPHTQRSLNGRCIQTTFFVYSALRKHLDKWHIYYLSQLLRKQF